MKYTGPNNISPLPPLKIWWLLSLFTLTLVSFSCQEKSKEAANGKLQIVTTTGIIADAAREIAGDKAEVISIMGPGVDPHLYKATQGDLLKLRNADLIIYNGLHLEGKMSEVLEKLGRKKKVIALADGLPEKQLRKAAGFAGSYDPHIWFDVSIWNQASQFLASELKKFDPKNAAAYQANEKKYSTRLDSLHQATGKQIQNIPENQRVLITAHDAFGYYGRAYGIEVRGLQGISTVSEFGLRDVSGLVEFIVSRKIKAVFVESSVPRKSIEAVVNGCEQRGHQVKIGGTLFSDALGPADSPEGTYVGMVSYNTRTIAESLK
jgi:manganese/zinc/iron transport system substrate-binding protein